jgi:hypothetical protein
MPVDLRNIGLLDAFIAAPTVAEQVAKFEAKMINVAKDYARDYIIAPLWDMDVCFTEREENLHYKFDATPAKSIAKMEPLFVMGDGDIGAKAYIRVAKKWDEKGNWTGLVTWRIDCYYYVNDWFRDVLDPFDKIEGWQEFPGCTAYAINGSWIDVLKGEI